MNLCILLTAANADDIKAFCEATASKQTEPVNGGLSVVHDDALSTDFVKGIVGSILHLFKAKAFVRGNINHSSPTDGKIASLLSTFILAAYSSHPGPWLIVDGPGKPIKDNFFSKLDSQHRSFGGRVTGRGKRNPGSIAPQGPITLELTHKQLKLMRFTTHESWRTRGQFLFGQSGFGFIPASEFFFEGADETQDASPVKVAPMESEVQIFKRPDLSAIPKPTLDIATKPDGSRLASLGMDDVNGNPITLKFDLPPVEVDLLGETIRHITPEDGFAPLAEPSTTAEPTDFSFEHPELPLTKDQLLDAVEAKTGKRPHHFTGEAKLQELLNS